MRRHARAGTTGLEISVTDARGRTVRAPGLAAWLRRASPRGRGRMAIALVTDRTMRRLNATYRDADYPTDVLSFPAAPGGEDLGDIAIALGTARRQAREQGHSLSTELRVLALHGLLHLLGYDHETDDGRMRRVEERLRRRAGLKVGLIARAHRERRP